MQIKIYTDDREREKEKKRERGIIPRGSRKESSKYYAELSGEIIKLP